MERAPVDIDVDDSRPARNAIAGNSGQMNAGMMIVRRSVCCSACSRSADPLTPRQARQMRVVRRHPGLQLTGHVQPGKSAHASNLGRGGRDAAIQMPSAPPAPAARQTARARRSPSPAPARRRDQLALALKIRIHKAVLQQQHDRARKVFVGISCR